MMETAKKDYKEKTNFSGFIKMDVDMTNDFTSIVGNRLDTIQKRKEYKEKAVKSWRYNLQFEPDKRRTPVKVDFNLNIKFAAACKASDFHDIKKYLDEGANINYVGPDGLTALHNAIIDNNCEIVKLLVENGSDVNIQDPMYWTPLHSAIEMGNLEIIQILLDNGADPSLMNSDEKLPIDLAKDDNIIKVIKKKMDALEMDIDDLRIKERQSIRRDILKWYKDKKWDEKPHPLTGCYAIHVCAAKNYLPELYALVAHKICDPNIKDYDGWTPLHGAVYWNNYDAAILLINNGADIHAKTNINENILDICDTDETKNLAKDILNEDNQLKEDIAKYELDKFQLPDEKSDVSETDGDESITNESVDDVTIVKPKNIEETSTSNSMANNENVDKFISGVPWDRTNKLKKVENNVKLFNSINANRCNVVLPNQKMTHDESESERKMISKQRRSARRSTRGITQEELKEVINTTKKKDDILFTSSSSSYEDSLNKLPFINSRSNVLKRSEIYNSDKTNHVETFIQKTNPLQSHTSPNNQTSISPSYCLKDVHNNCEENGYNDQNKQSQEHGTKMYKFLDTNLPSKKPISFSQSFTPYTNLSIKSNKNSEISDCVEKTPIKVSENLSNITSNEDTKNDNTSTKLSKLPTIYKNDEKGDDNEINYKTLYLLEKEAHEKLQKDFIKLQNENSMFKQKLDKMELELKNSQNERDKLEQLKSENSALVRVLGKLTKEDGYKKN
ncbi:Ankyrin repeat and Ankyrin repeat-containing domain-containing protein [Strongyloides ratti]|uniref:Ankyrin repeat and Ankyrin repeat-containing domain-containing protein n=1 Tax=Strongyloides ratti TaxID=34506 RepID=A0A090LLS6_STRRB|nr:Ankyrin repeat and Ankyrin repeat-containing domain-containing protein [Strongyloides ratti]CEF70760.1 Ankyrin repeat and Ankyrin repeat-containing domain-containing protein [Strongyloides ratti]